MSSYLNDDEQVEALKNWWKENGKAVILGISLGIGSVIGWQGWDRYKISQNENASVIFSVMEQQFFRNVSSLVRPKMVVTLGSLYPATS